MKNWQTIHQHKEMQTKIKTELHLNKSRYYLELLTTETIELLVVTEGRLLKIKMIKINLV